MPAVVEECFFNFRDTRKYIDDRETLYGKVDDTGFHPRLDDAIVAAFERLDREVKAEDDRARTAAVIFLRKGAANAPGFAAGDVIVKCAWVGDSRAVMFRDGELSSLVDLSRDHKPECAREVARSRTVQPAGGQRLVRGPRRGARRVHPRWKGEQAGRLAQVPGVVRGEQRSRREQVGREERGIREQEPTPGRRGRGRTAGG